MMRLHFDLDVDDTGDYKQAVIRLNEHTMKHGLTDSEIASNALHNFARDLTHALSE